ncbi:MAG: gluconokinase [Candidatus Rokuibacteriota bacterium]
MTVIRPTRAEPPLILALDVGTSSARALLFDRRGRALRGIQARVSYAPRTTPDGGSELDPQRLFAAVCRVLDGCLRRAGARATEIRGVATSMFWHSLIGMDAAGKPLTPCYTWADLRSDGAARELRQKLDESAVHARTGCPLHPTFFPARLRWLATQHPETFTRTQAWGGFWEYLALRLFGSRTCSLSMASGSGLLDQAGCAWDAEVLAISMIDERRLSPVADLDAPLRELRTPFARRWPPLARVPWFPAVGDGACANIGSGCVSPERLALTLGTSGAMRIVTEAEPGTVPWGLWRYRVDRRRSVVGGALSEGGNVVAWCRETLRLPAPRAAERAIARLAADGHGLTVLPFFAGERSPGWSGKTRAAILGLSLSHRPAHIMRAAMEAVAYRFALLYDLLRGLAAPHHEIVASGGALAGSPAWCQILSDVLGRSITLSPQAEASSRGAALLGLEALGVIPNLRALPGGRGRPFTPHPRRHAEYGEARKRQYSLYDQICRIAPLLTY